ncbi:MAG: ABC transporter substrate-binding protein [Dethiobacter sp.]|nr:ABC transporter substrate-binding protein [Dethiobacter sp.]
MFRRLGVLSAVMLLAALVLISCAPREAAEPDPATPDTKHGGILRFAFYAPTNMDPAFLSTVADDHVARQWSDFLVFFDEENKPDPSRSVAESWEPDETGTIWTFNLRRGIKFHDGKEMTSRDVKFTFDRLRDPAVGAATVTLYSNIQDITAPDDYTVVFHLKNPNPDFLKDLFDYHALIMDADNTDFAVNWNGTGPFIIESYLPEDRIIFRRNPNYWMSDAEGNQLPYLDGMEFIFMSDSAAQVEALRGGQVDYLIYLPSEFVPVLEEDPNIDVYRKPSNTHYVLRMRSDRAPANDVRVRQALKAATDRSAILKGAIGGLGVIGQDTPIGPSFGEFYLDLPEPRRDVEKARRLLSEAGYADGLNITLVTQSSSPVPSIAAIWKEQMAEAGVNVEIQLVPPDVYYGADNMWLEVDFAITDWGSRPYPQPYLDLAYTTDAPWNESHWSDPELDELAAAAAKEMDPAARVQLYHRIQEIFIERGPVIIPFFVDNMWGARTHVRGLKPTATLGTALDLRRVYLEQ